MTVTTLLAKNEITNFTSSAVNAVLLAGGDDLVRKPSQIDNWNKIRIYYKATIVGSPATGFATITGSRMFVGMCSESRSYATTNSQSCVGVAFSTNLAVATMTAVTDAQTNPATQCYMWQQNSTAFACVTGSTSNGGASQYEIPRYETAWSSSNANSRMMGDCWNAFYIEIIRTGATHTLSHNRYQSGGGKDASCRANVPKGIADDAVYHYQSSGLINAVGVYDSWLPDVGSSMTAFSANAANQALSTAFNDALWGHPDYLNIYWQCPYPGMSLAIRDLQIVKLA